MGFCGSAQDSVCADTPLIAAMQAAHVSQHAKKFNAILMCAAL
jgi:hypothetical protein